MRKKSDENMQKEIESHSWKCTVIVSVGKNLPVVYAVGKKVRKSRIFHDPKARPGDLVTTKLRIIH